MEALPSDQYTIKVNGSNRLIRRDRKLLRAWAPALEQEGLWPPHSPDGGSNDESDSAWGARGHGTWSADPNNESDETVTEGQTRATVATEETPRLKAPNSPQKVDRRRSSRASEAKTSRH